MDAAGKAKSAGKEKRTTMDGMPGKKNVQPGKTL